MSERQDDTPDANEPSRERSERPRGSYYYDDSTGYEIYDPNADTDEDDKDESNIESEKEKL